MTKEDTLKEIELKVGKQKDCATKEAILKDIESKKNKSIKK